MPFHVKDDFKPTDKVFDVPASWYNAVGRFLNTLCVTNGGAFFSKPVQPSENDPVTLVFQPPAEAASGVPDGTADGQLLQWNDTTEAWEPVDVEDVGIGPAEDPGATITTIGAASEGTETASTDTWTAGNVDNKGLAEWYVSRVVYNHSGDKKIYAFLRKRTYDQYGRLYSVSGETRVEVEAPTVMS
jgi:hypothetical protein